MKWQEVMTFLSGLGMGAMLVQKNGIIAAINEVGKSWFYNLFWGAKVTVQMRVLSAPTFFSIKK